MQCRSCSFHLLPAARICPRCGQKQTFAPIPPSQPPIPTQPHTTPSTQLKPPPSFQPSSRPFSYPQPKPAPSFTPTLPPEEPQPPANMASSPKPNPSMPLEASLTLPTQDTTENQQQSSTLSGVERPAAVTTTHTDFPFPQRTRK